MTIGQLIEKLALINIREWHEDTKVRNRHSLPIKLTNAEIGKLSRAGRELNRQRADTRYEINSFFGEITEDRKIRYVKCNTQSEN
jgi:hypothetical protein